MSGIPLDGVYGPDDGEFPGQYPYTRGPVRVDVPLEALDDADVRRLRHRRRHQLAVQGDHQDRRRRPVDRVRHAHPARPRLRRPDVARRGRPLRCGDRQPGRHGGPLRRHRPRRHHHVDDDQLARRTDLRDVRRPGREGGDRAQTPRRHVAERHPEGVPGAEGVRLPAAPVDAPRARHDLVHRRRDAALALDLDLRLPHPRGRLDGRRGAGVHARQRLRLRRTRAAGRPAGRRVRPAAELLLQRPHRLLRGDLQVPRRPPDLGALDEGALRRRVGALDAAALPHADRRRLAHRAAARGEHRPHGDRSARRRARRHAEPAHQLDGRGARPAHREGGPHRAAHPAGDRPGDQRRPRGRSARRLVLRRVADRRDGTAGRGDLRPPRPSSATGRSSTG